MTRSSDGTLVLLAAPKVQAVLESLDKKFRNQARAERAVRGGHEFHTTAAERRAGEREADTYFSDPALPEHLRQFTVFAESPTEHMLKNGARMRDFAEA